VREYAVSILRSASDDELLTFLLQLVQALRYEPSPTVSATAAPVVDYALDGTMVGVARLNIKADSEAPAPTAAPVAADGSSAAVATTAVAAASSAVSLPAAPGTTRNAGALSPLATFLVDRACSSPVVANYLYWYLKVETEDEVAGAMFQAVYDEFIVRLSTSGPEGKMMFLRISALDEYIAKISACQRDAREARGRKPEKEQALIKLLDERHLDALPHGVDWIPMPLDPSIQLMGLIPTTASMFASAVYPCVIEFVDYADFTAQQAASAAAVASGGKPVAKTKPKTHKIMFKSGDDLRQDQLIMQMIALMDRLLKKVNLDLKLLTYGILAVSQKDGTFSKISSSLFCNL
jgi:phosphatidylinositol 3-kinase